MKKIKTKSGKYVVLKRNGKAHFVKKASKAMLVEAPDDIEINEKYESQLTKEEKERGNVKQLKKGKVKKTK